MSDLVLVPLGDGYFVNRLSLDSAIPEPATEGFWSLTRTVDEISIVCPHMIANARVEGPWSMFRIAGTLDFSLTGVLHRVLTPLATARIGIFSLSTFDTDYILVSQGPRDDAIAAWRESGLTVTD